MKPTFPSPFISSIKANLTIWIPSSISNPSPQIKRTPIDKISIDLFSPSIQLHSNLIGQFWGNLLIGVYKHDPILCGEISGILILIAMPCPLSPIDFIGPLFTDFVSPILAEGVDDHQLFSPRKTFQTPFNRPTIVVCEVIYGNRHL